MRRSILISSAILGLVATASGDTYVVNPEGTGDFPTIQAAVTAAVDGDTIELTVGTFYGPENRNVNYQGKAITIRSQTGDPNGCIIDCQGVTRGFDFSLGEGSGSILEGVTVTQGAQGPGGAVRCWGGASPTIRDCFFTHCTASMIGGAVCFASYGTPTLTNCTFIANSTTFGGAVICWVDTEPTITGCTFIGNSAWFGAAIECADRAHVTVEGCTFWGNDAERGGAVMCEEDSEVTIRNCTFHENVAYEGGAAVACEVNGHVFLENAVLAFSTSGEAILCSSSSSATLTCCDVFGNAGGDWVGHIADQYGINGNISEDPLFCDPEEGNFSLQIDSPCAPFSPPNPECDLIGAWPVGCDPQGIEGEMVAPGMFLEAGAPNPFSGETHIRCRVPSAATRTSASLRVFDGGGRRVRTLTEDVTAATAAVFLWDGTDDSGAGVPGGVYFIRLVSGSEVLTGRVVLVR
ncbi:MAG: right-handed parallel beta-helix repeat-containing protein [Candidatus Eisenbacteria sp.]|nr:right-handed parallel beta-helix repeat-containing protein [Candidatus Eisenbacteria bacterium]